MTLGGIRRRPTLPGRFQPSTISVLRLNFCVRDGNRWIPQAIVTGNWAGPKPLRCRLERGAFHRARCRLSGSVGSAIWPPDFPSRLSLRASHPQNRTGPGSASARPRLPLLPFDILPHKPSGFGLAFAFGSRPLAFARLRSPTPYSLFPTPYSQDQALDRLVSPSSTRYRASTDDLSTLSSSRGLTYL